MRVIKVNELFSGIGAFRKALENLEMPHEIVGISEIDKFAIKSYEAIYGKTRNYGDISKIDKLDYADLWTYGFPCTDISLAGKQAGIVKGETRSGLLFEVERLLIESQKADELPKYLIMENVKNLVSKKFIADFERWLEFLKSLGYTNHWQVLNAKDYGIPQNRERVFCISILEDKRFRFPEKQTLRLRLKDLLENEVDEKFYLAQKQTDKIEFSIFNMQKSRIQEKNYCDTLSYTNYKLPKCIQIGQYDTPTRKNSNMYRVYDERGISPTIHTCQGGNLQPSIRIKNSTKKGFLEAVDGDGIDLAFPASKHRIYDSGVATAVATSLQPNYLDSAFRVRKLTPKECWRLMGFDDKSFEKAERVCSNTQLYKQAGNSIVVNVLERILENLLQDRPWETEEITRSEWLDELLGGDE